MYFDCNASAPMSTATQNAVMNAMTHYGNPSSVHQAGRQARALVENCRGKLARMFGVSNKQIVFTASATEAANWVATPDHLDHDEVHKFDRFLVSGVEHACLQRGGRFEENQVTQINIGQNGQICLNHLEKLLSETAVDGGNALVAVMAANNETGVIQPLEQVWECVQRHNGVLVVDGVQLFGKQDMAHLARFADYIILSGHKCGGPKGVGVLVMMGDGMVPGALITGGSQENTYRSGTENVASIAGLGAALEEFEKKYECYCHVMHLRDKLERAIHGIAQRYPEESFEVQVFGADSPRLPNTSCFALKGVKAETALIALDLQGICVSSGSACSSGKISASHVLQAMGVDDEIATCALRVSFTHDASEKDVDCLIDALSEIVDRTMMENNTD